MNNNKAWIVTVDMGYGHLRAAYPLRHLSPTGELIFANNYEGIPARDQRIWKNSRKLYEFFSRFNNIPVVGKHLFGIFDYFQKINSFYPIRDQSDSTLQLSESYKLIQKGWGKHLVEYLNTKDIPLITPFFTIAFFAEEHGFKNEIYLIVCDADISRAWAPLYTKNTKINYCVPCKRAASRLEQYGVPKKNIFITGFPLPKEALGNLDLSVLKSDLAARIPNLDQEGHYRRKYSETISEYLNVNIPENTSSNHPLTLTFAVGGAGAQRALAKELVLSLQDRIRKGDIYINLVAGSRKDVYKYFLKLIKKLNLNNLPFKNLHIIYDPNKIKYFEKFNKIIGKTDILWTKPSELSFYTALGMPIIMAPTIGSQEKYNKEWLIGVGGGLEQRNVKFTNEWLFDWIKSGWLAEAAMSGFLDGRQYGVYNIESVVFGDKTKALKESKLL